MPHRDNHSSRKRDYSVNRDAVKALVAVYGPREAARQANLPAGTVLAWCKKFKWKKASYIKPGLAPNGVTPGDDAAAALTAALEKHRENSTLHLAQYTAKAAEKASKHENPLEIARKVRDVAGIHQIIFPQEEQEGLIEGAILIGTARVTDNPQEIMARAVIVDEDVRKELPDQRPEGD